MTVLDLRHGDADGARVLARKALLRGELVVLPTETVYGLAARETALGALDALKGGRHAPYSLALPRLSEAARLVPDMPGPARRAAKRWWPGPVTLVLPDLSGKPLGLRVPGQPWTRSLLEDLGEPLLLTSANCAGEPAPVTVAQISRAVRDGVALIADDGRCALGEASTVVACGPAAMAVLREGVVARADLDRLASGRVLVVCSGNTCRSPMAAELLRRELLRRATADPRLILPEVTSAGLFAAAGQPASRSARQVAAPLGLDLDSHASRPLEQALDGPLDCVLAMTRTQLGQLAERLDTGQVLLELFDPGGAEVLDPFGAPPAEYQACVRMLADMAARRAASLLPALEPTAP